MGIFNHYLFIRGTVKNPKLPNQRFRVGLEHSRRAHPRPFPTTSTPFPPAFTSSGMMVVMAEVGDTSTLSQAKSPEHSLMTPEHIENPISWCEMVIASQDIHYASHEMTISHRERRFTMYIDGMW